MDNSSKLLYAYFGPFRGREIGKCLSTLKKIHKAIKQTFMCNFFVWVKVYVGDYSISMMEFVLGIIGLSRCLQKLPRGLLDLTSRSIDHILLHCGNAKVLWEVLFSLFNVY